MRKRYEREKECSGYDSIIRGLRMKWRVGLREEKEREKLIEK
jgi:hypothetical protein